MSTTEIKELVDKGITALKAGDREEARFWLAEAIQQDARNERAWVYLAAVLPRQQAIAALERVLVLNPQNAKAQKGLNILFNQPATTQATRDEEPPRPTRTLPRPSIISRSDRRNSRRPDRTIQADSPEIKTESVSGFDKQPVVPFIPPTTPFAPPIVLHMGVANTGGEVEAGTEKVVFDRGFHTLDTDREGAETDIDPHEEPLEEDPALEPPVEEEPAEFADQVRKILNTPYPVLRQPRRLSPLSTFLLVLLPVVVVGAFIFFVVLNPGASKNNQTPVALDTNSSSSPAAISNLNNSTFTVPTELSPEPVPVTTVADFTPTPDVPTAAPPTPTSRPAPTAPPVIKVDVAQGERAVLRGLAVTFNSYENRSNNFSFAGAGTPKNGFHFEGVTVSLENTGDKLVPVRVDAFQGVDGRNNYLKALGGGRVPSMDISRLQMGEQRIAWLTFEVEDGTTLRRVTFNPTSEPDLNNSASVNLTLPAVTPAPVVKPTPVPTATPLPTATPAPTATPGPTSTVVVAGTANQLVNMPLTADPTEIVVSPSPQSSVSPTVTPLPTATPVPTATPLPTRLPAQVGQMNQRLVMGNFAVTVTAFQGGPSIKPPPLILPPGYHYETVKITVENVGDSDVSDYLGSYPFFLRDGDNRIFSVGPESLDANATDRFNPQTFAPTVIGAGKKSVTGVLYFLVKDLAPPGRTFIFYANNNLDSLRIEVPLK